MLLLAHGKLAGSLERAEWAFEATSVTYRAAWAAGLRRSRARPLEKTKDAARELLLGNLDVAINFDGGRSEGAPGA